MTIDLDSLEALYVSRKFTLGSVPDTVLELIAELRQARAERDWLAEHIPNTVCPEGKSECDDRTPTAGGTVGYACLLCWLNAAREAVEGKR